MAKSYTQQSYGSSGDDVKKLQSYLNQVGNYGLDTDGVYGSKTQAAVKDYQTKNGLTVDGIAGDETWGSLTSAISNSTTNSGNAGSTGSTSQDTAQPAPDYSQNTAQTAPDYSQYSYDPSTDAAYQQALAALQQATAAVPTYQASYDKQLQDIYNQIVNRDKFSYDLNSDALYQQYADQYQLMGQQAMMDTMGQAAALTGGYGNSFASTAGNQAYQGYLQQLNSIVPDLYGMALDRYNQEGQDLLNQYSMLGDMADTEYARYQDQLNQYWQNLSYAKEQADTAYDRGYTDWLNSYQMGANADATAYERQQDAYNNLVNLITSTGYTPTEEDLLEAGMSPEQAAAYAEYYKKQNGITTSGGSSGKSYYDENAARRQRELVAAGYDVTVDGIWGSQSKKAWEDYKKGKEPAIKEAIVTDTEIDDNTVSPEMETKMLAYVRNMLDNATSSQFNPKAVINANSSLSAAEKKIALEILEEYLSIGYMK